jgi:hypothetical protein
VWVGCGLRRVVAVLRVAEGSRGRRYHVVVSTDGNHYTTWQTRIMYYWYCQAKKAYPDSDMGGFTRLLHRWGTVGVRDECHGCDGCGMRWR